MSARDEAATVLAEAFDEWMFRMHGVTSSCDHKVEAEAMADALIANALLVTDEQREVYNDLRRRIARAEALAEKWLGSTRRDGHDCALELRVALEVDA